MLTIGVDANVAGALRANQMHRIGDHDRAFVEMVLMAARGLAHAVRWRLKRRNEIFEVQSILPVAANLRTS